MSEVLDRNSEYYKVCLWNILDLRWVCSFFHEERGDSGGSRRSRGKRQDDAGQALSRLLEEDAAVAGEVVIAGSSLYEKKEEEVRRIRMELFSIVFQNSGEWLNPSMRLREQLRETLIKKYPAREHRERMKTLMEMVGAGGNGLRALPGPAIRRDGAEVLLANAMGTDTGNGDFR